MRLEPSVCGRGNAVVPLGTLPRNIRASLSLTVMHFRILRSLQTPRCSLILDEYVLRSVNRFWLFVVLFSGDMFQWRFTAFRELV